MPEVARGSEVALYFAEEETFGKPDWTYGSAEHTVGSFVAPGSRNITVTTTPSTISAGDEIVTFTGSLASPVNVQVHRVTNKTGSTLEVSEQSAPNLPIPADALLREVGSFLPSKMRRIGGVVTSSLSAEVGEIASEALAAGTVGERVRAKGRRGSITAEGGSFVVEPGIKGFGRLLRHAVGAKMDYAPMEQSENPAVSTTLTGSSNDRGDLSITVASAASIDDGDRIRIGDSSDEYEVHTVASQSSNTLTLDGRLIRDHGSGEAVIVVNGVQNREIRKSNLPPSFTLYQFHSDLDVLFIMYGVRIGSFEFSASNDDATVRATFNTVARSVNIVRESFISFPAGDAHVPFTNLEMAVRRTRNAGVNTYDRVVGVNTLTINGDNELSPTRALDGTGQIASAPEGTGRWTAEVNYQLFDANRFVDALREFPAHWSFDLVYGDQNSDGEKIEFFFPNTTIIGNVVPSVDQSAGLSADATVLAGINTAKETNFYVQVTENDGGYERRPNS